MDLRRVPVQINVCNVYILERDWPSGVCQRGKVEGLGAREGERERKWRGCMGAREGGREGVRGYRKGYRDVLLVGSGSVRDVMSTSL